MKYLFILNDPAYGTERSYNGLRLAMTLLTQEPDAEVRVFLMGDAVTCAKAGQKTPDGYYNLERMLKPIVRKGEVLLCGTCMDARAMTETEIGEGTRRSSMSELTAKTDGRRQGARLLIRAADHPPTSTPKKIAPQAALEDDEQASTGRHRRRLLRRRERRLSAAAQSWETASS